MRHTYRNTMYTQTLSISNTVAELDSLTHLTGLRNQLLATRSTRLPNVADRNSVCRSGRTFSNIELICFSKPMSSWKMRVVMICHDEREVIVTNVSACGVKAVK